MKAIVCENSNGVKDFLIFESEEIVFEVFRKICIGTGTVLCTSEEQFENMKTEFDYALLSEIIYKKFLGVGLYDWDGNFHDKIIHEDAMYYIIDFVEQTNDIRTTKVELEFIFLN